MNSQTAAAEDDSHMNLVGGRVVDCRDGLRLLLVGQEAGRKSSEVLCLVLVVLIPP